MAQAKEAGDAAMEVDEATRTRIDALHEKLEQGKAFHLANKSAQAEAAYKSVQAEDGDGEELDEGELSDEQRKELDEYNAKIKAQEEEREKYRKALELELKKLRIEVTELCKAFDEKVKECADQRVPPSKDELGS